MMREVADGNVSPQEAVRAYHGELQKQRIKPLRPLEDDMAITEPVLKQALSGPTMSQGRNFASDNTAPVAPEVMEAILAANRAPAASYGGDASTERLTALAREVFETELAIFPVATGTAANGLALAALARPTGRSTATRPRTSCSRSAARPEFYTGGAKLIGLPGAAGKLAPERSAQALALAEAAGVHHAEPAALSLTQATEWGTVYRPAEIAALAERCPRARPAPAHGRRAARQRHRAAGLLAGGRDLARRRRRAVARRHQERRHGGGGGAGVRSGTRHGLGRAAQARAATSSPRCGSSAPSSSPCSRTASGCATPRTPTPWPTGWPRR